MFLAGWWFKKSFIFHNIWDVILPIDELIFFKMVIAPSTSWGVFQVMFSHLRKKHNGKSHALENPQVRDIVSSWSLYTCLTYRLSLRPEHMPRVKINLLGALEPWNFMTFPSYWECHHPN